MIIWICSKNYSQEKESKAYAKLIEQAEKLQAESHGQLVYVEASDLDVLTERAKAENPAVSLFVSSPTADALAARLAVRLNTGISIGCFGMKYIPDEEKVHWIRPVYDNSFLAETVCLPQSPQIGTLRITTQDPSLSWNEDMPIDDAEIVVCVGRGCGNGVGMHLVKELARMLGAAVGATRSVTDAGWLPISKQIGQTGKYIRPRIYIGIGVAGAIQHLAGMRNADIIIAINKDARAPIFECADYGIVGDLYQVLPIMIEDFKKKHQTI